MEQGEERSTIKNYCQQFLRHVQYQIRIVFDLLGKLSSLQQQERDSLRVTQVDILDGCVPQARIYKLGIQEDILKSIQSALCDERFSILFDREGVREIFNQEKDDICKVLSVMIRLCYIEGFGTICSNSFYIISCFENAFQGMIFEDTTISSITVRNQMLYQYQINQLKFKQVQFCDCQLSIPRKFSQRFINCSFKNITWLGGTPNYSMESLDTSSNQGKIQEEMKPTLTVVKSFQNLYISILLKRPKKIIVKIFQKEQELLTCYLHHSPYEMIAFAGDIKGVIFIYRINNLRPEKPQIIIDTRRGPVDMITYLPDCHLVLCGSKSSLDLTIWKLPMKVLINVIGFSSNRLYKQLNSNTIESFIRQRTDVILKLGAQQTLSKNWSFIDFGFMKQDKYLLALSKSGGIIIIGVEQGNVRIEYNLKSQPQFQTANIHDNYYKPDAIFCPNNDQDLTALMVSESSDLVCVVKLKLQDAISQQEQTPNLNLFIQEIFSINDQICLVEYLKDNSLPWIEQQSHIIANQTERVLQAILGCNHKPVIYRQYNQIRLHSTKQQFLEIWHQDNIIIKSAAYFGSPYEEEYVVMIGQDSQKISHLYQLTRNQHKQALGLTPLRKSEMRENIQRLNYTFFDNYFLIIFITKHALNRQFVEAYVETKDSTRILQKMLLSENCKKIKVCSENITVLEGERILKSYKRNKALGQSLFELQFSYLHGLWMLG